MSPHKPQPYSSEDFFTLISELAALIREKKPLGCWNLLRQCLEFHLHHLLSTKQTMSDDYSNLFSPENKKKIAPIINNESVLELFYIINAKIRPDNHYNGYIDPKQLSIERITWITAEIIFLHLWLLKNVFGEQSSDFTKLFSALQGNSKLLVGRTYEKIEESINEWEEEKVGVWPEERRFAIYQNALSSSTPLSNANLLLIYVGLVAFRSKIHNPHIEITVYKKNTKLTCVTVTDCVSVILFSVESSDIILHAGGKISLQHWNETKEIVTNEHNFLEVLERNTLTKSYTENDSECIIKSLESTEFPKQYSAAIRHPANEHLSAEIKEKVFKETNSQLFQNYQKLNKDNNGFVNSSIQLLRKDNDLFFALSYPIDKWRLFLHPVQQKIINSAASRIYIKGGPGTGKTILLIHKIYQSLLNAKENEKAFLLCFTPTLGEYIGQLIRKMDIDPNRVIIYDLKKFHTLYQMNKIKWELDEPTRYLHLTIDGELSVITDLLIDEFQDLPTDKEYHFIKLIKTFVQSKGRFVCTYDEEQSIYHERSDYEQIRKIVGAGTSYKLGYCYRMAKEIAEIATATRKRMLQNLKQELSLSLLIEEGYDDKTPPAYAFSGGKVFVTPSRDPIAGGKLDIKLKELLKKYKPQEVAVITFLNDSQRKNSNELYERDLKALEAIKKKYNIKLFSTEAAKGLEFKAGIILNGHHPFEKFSRWIDQGMELQMFRIFLQMITSVIDDHKSFNSSEILYFLNDAKTKKMIKKDFNTKLVALAKEGGLDNDTLNSIAQLFFKKLHETKNNLASKIQYNNLNRAFELLKKNESINEKYITQSLKYFTTMFLEQCDKEWKDFELYDFESLFLPTNRFYVALTRFRQEVTVFYNDKAVDMKKLLPIEILDSGK